MSTNTGGRSGDKEGWGDCGRQSDSYMPLSPPDLMISALGTCRLCWRLEIFFQHQLSSGEIKQIIWQAVYIFRSIRSGGRVPPCRRAADQSELSWDNPSCQSVKTAAWWDPATARIIFWISFSPSSQHYLAWEISLTLTHWIYILHRTMFKMFVWFRSVSTTDVLRLH